MVRGVGLYCLASADHTDEILDGRLHAHVSRTDEKIKITFLGIPLDKFMPGYVKNAAGRIRGLVFIVVGDSFVG